MCEYVKDNTCEITKQVCPWRYLCPKDGQWKNNKYMPANCKVKLNIQVPEGYNKVREERKGWLYIDVENETIRIKNPFDYTPLYVRIKKLKNGEYKIRE